MNTCNGCPHLKRVIDAPEEKYQTHHECKLHGEKLYWDEDQNPTRCDKCDGKKEAK